ncbi:VOC family protein [Candidatus Pacebacteria bacterium]|nr:VOC family protein [Candidatus Paceibacterota bacterium]
MKQKLSIVTLGVSSIEKSKAFYEDLLGFRSTADSNENIIFYDMDGVTLGLFQREALAKDASVEAAGSGFRGVTLAHNEPSEAAVDALFAELREKGVTIVKAPEKVFWGGYSGYFADPDGHLWEVAYNPHTDLT